MTVIGIDDTDSRERGMCTTYAATRLARRIEAAGGDVARTLLIRCNPAVEHKTRGNAALAVHCDFDADRARSLTQEILEMAETDDANTNPGAVVADCGPEAVPEGVATHAVEAVRDLLDAETARRRIEAAGFDSLTAGNGRGLIGALAAVGAWRAFEEWTYEAIAYRERAKWGTERSVDRESVRATADAHYPAVWDTVDRASGYPVCVPRTPCPILYGVRGDDPDAVVAAAEAIDSEPVAERQVFVTNQGTDAHLRDAALGDVVDGRAFRVTGEVVESPETRAGGHVFLTLGADGDRLDCAAFEPTKRFRDRVRALRTGDQVTACGEVSDGTLKLEKFAVRDLVETERVTPECPDCARSMESAGRNQGYRCRDCGTDRAGKAVITVDRDLETGWYEVPPSARRHVSRPLVRGGFDAPTHPER